MRDGVFDLRVGGEYACFSRPEFKVERVSYLAMTPSAARGVLEAIFWKPEVRWEVREIWLLKPMTFMNLSGAAVQSVAGFYKIPLDAVLVAHDELDFPPGVVRLKHGGGAGGHNGLRDIMARLGASFWRLRIGIGHPGARDAVLNYVLGRPAAADAEAIGAALRDAADALPVMLEEGAQKAMNQLHTRTDAASSDRPA